MWALYLLVGVILAAGVFVLGAQYGKQLAAKARAEAEQLKQDAERLGQSFTRH